MNAIVFRRILLAVAAVLVILTGASYYFLSGMLKARAIETDHARIDASVNSNDINRLKQLQTQLTTLQDVVTRARDIVGSSTDFKYQDQVIKDINSLAAQTGVTVTGYTFTGSTSSGVAPVAPVPGAAAITAKKVAITIAIQSPLPYDNYLRFLRSIELNLTRLQVTGINLAPDTSNTNNVINPSIGIEIFVRE